MGDRLEDILTPAEIDELFAKLEAWRARTIAETQAEECTCRDPISVGFAYHQMYPCSRCLVLRRLTGRCCDA